MSPEESLALDSFTDYMVRNYPGPDTIISDPAWHAPRIFRAALHALSSANAATLKAAQGGVTEAMVEDKAREMYEAYRTANPDARMHPWEWQTFKPTLDHWRRKARAALEAALSAEPAARGGGL